MPADHRADLVAIARVGEFATLLLGVHFGRDPFDAFAPDDGEVPRIAIVQCLVAGAHAALSDLSVKSLVLGDEPRRRGFACDGRRVTLNLAAFVRVARPGNLAIRCKSASCASLQSVVR